MKVRALGDPEMVVGYYNHQRRRGREVFEIKSENDFSANWMEKVDASAKIVEEEKSLKKRGRKVVVNDLPDETESAIPPQDDEGVL